MLTRLVRGVKNFFERKPSAPRPPGTRQEAVRRVTQSLEKELAFFQTLKDNGHEVEGTVVASSAYYDRAEGETGRTVTFRFTTLTGQTITGQDRSTVHRPTAEQWQTYIAARQAGATLRVLYDQDNPHLHKAIFQGESFSADTAVASVQAELQRLNDFFNRSA